MKIGDLAKRSGLSAHTLRYYEKSGILIPQNRSDNNYRLYTDDDLGKAKFIKHAREIGFSLSDVQIFLSIRADKPAHICAEAKSIAEHKIAQVKQQIKDLTKIVKNLHQLSDACCGGEESAEHCSIIDALENS